MEITLKNSWHIICKRRSLMIYATLCPVLLSLGSSLFLPKVYRAETVIMPITKSAGMGGLMSGAQGLATMASLAGMGGSSMNPSSQMMALLRSRTLAESVINAHPALLELSHKKNKLMAMDEVVRGLGAKVRFIDDRRLFIIKIFVELEDPQLAAELANGYVRGLQDFISGNAFTVAKRNRLFIEQQLVLNKDELLESGKRLNLFYSRKRVSSESPQFDVQLEEDVHFSADTNEIDVKDAWFLSKENRYNKSAKTVKEVPQQIYLQYLTLRQQTLAQVNGLLNTQHQLAKIEENKEELAFQIIDRAEVPLYPYKPKVVLVVLTTFLVSLFGAVIAAHVAEYSSRVKV